jgi:hypothetical protein
MDMDMVLHGDGTTIHFITEEVSDMGMAMLVLMEVTMAVPGAHHLITAAITTW